MDTSFDQIGKIAFPIVYKAVADAIRADQNHTYGLMHSVDYGVIRTTHFAAFDYEDDFLLVEKVDENRAHWWLKAFSPDSGIWDGTSLLPDKGTADFDALFKASLFHDVGYERAEAISKATGIPVEALLAFFDDCLRILSRQYGASASTSKSVWWLTRVGGSLYHKIKRWFSVIVVAALTATLVGCFTLQTEIENETPPEIHWTGPFIVGETK